MQELARLREENDRLKAEVDYLKSALVPPGWLPARFRLTALEERLFKALLSREQATKEQLLTAAYSHVFSADEIPHVKIIDVLICKVRRKLTPFGVEINTIWGKGYSIPADMRQKVADIIKSEATAVAAITAEASA
ncbi:hypothetical protein BA190_09580 [Labrys sp. WJW]|uniref:winged helix-turn-helix domain-containing protein n=1 Tax=Labrys sp. WJW TaxID=1737983 RepID=UPI00083288A9|nr:winged helix-turn-helix domain-containing protein [Labrys sp. WJW]OCC05155.1 hypothetical protein BA190_09580 [Labrys sp. WJW]